jgi:hypothetical protein
LITVKVAVAPLRTINAMNPQYRTIPIAVASRAAPIVVLPPALHGPAETIGRLLERLHPAIDAEFGRPVQDGEWLASIDLSDGEAVVRLKGDLGCHAVEVAELTFAAMRRVLPDTDLYVGA